LTSPKVKAAAAIGSLPAQAGSSLTAYN
jgi:hypothetical protein